MGPFERTFDFVLYFRSTLAQIRPFVWVLEEAMFVGTLSAPNDTSGCASRVETSVRLVAFVCVAELAMDLGVSFWSS
jgi:hypothetical protein